ncbi:MULTISPECIES: PepSY-associated TM helix domain-containing protein [unclassified Sphingomonas]|uniref:PepSY-associated TM helix domain-containing protein n=1 Tax=unclassified Sphingomonas TaxID=196159 RepID=UPI0025CF01D9|nr:MULTISPECIES: PepSY-associated TM helix domain-containing protein [unclassified Sphingomonas]
MRAPSNDFTRRMLGGHGWLGLTFGAILYAICLSGTLIVLVDQLGRWERPHAPVVRGMATPRLATTIDRAFARARAEHLDHDLIVRMPSEGYPRMSVFAIGEGPSAEWSVDAAGRIGDPVATPFVAFVQLLHFNLTVPGAIGRYLVGIFGTMLLASLGTGILAHRRIFKDAFRLRWGGSRRRSNADLHNRIGVWALPFHLVVSLTGSLLGLSGLIIMIVALIAYRGDQDKAIASLLGPQPTRDARPAPLPDVAAMIARVQRDIPGAGVTQIFFHEAGRAGQIAQVAVAAPAHLARNETFTFAGDGRLLAKAGYTDGSVGMRVYGMITPLHYGTYGGLPLKLIYVVLGAGLTLIVATGGTIWLARRREQGRAAPRLERAWPAVLWGQPIGILLAALAGFVALPALPVYWSATVALLLGAQGLRSPEMVGAIGRGTAALLALAIGAIHLATTRPGDPVALAIDAVLIAAGSALLWRQLAPAG